MNFLLDEFPTAIMIGNKKCEINSDFRTSLRIILAYEDDNLAMVEKQMLLINNLYKKQPENMKEAFYKGLKFLNGGKENGEEEKEEVLRLYSFEKDSNYIFSAFRQTHGIDLETAQMHWWKFIALFNDLGPDTFYCNLVNLRERVKSEKATKEEREAYNKLGSIAEIDDIDTRTLEEKEADEKFFSLPGVK